MYAKYRPPTAKRPTTITIGTRELVGESRMISAQIDQIRARDGDRHFEAPEGEATFFALEPFANRQVQDHDSAVRQCYQDRAGGDQLQQRITRQCEQHGDTDDDRQDGGRDGRLGAGVHFRINRCARETVVACHREDHA